MKTLTMLALLFACGGREPAEHPVRIAGAPELLREAGGAYVFRVPVVNEAGPVDVGCIVESGAARGIGTTPLEPDADAVECSVILGSAGLQSFTLTLGYRFEDGPLVPGDSAFVAR